MFHVPAFGVFQIKDRQTGNINALGNMLLAVAPVSNEPGIFPAALWRIEGPKIVIFSVDPDAGSTTGLWSK